MVPTFWYKNANSSFIYYGPKLKPIKMSTNKGMYKQTVALSQNGSILVQP